MEAELSRAIAELYNTPYWRYVMNSMGTDERRRSFGREFHDRLVKISTVGNLPKDILGMIEYGKKSEAIAKRLRLDQVIPQDLAQIMEKTLNASYK